VSLWKRLFGMHRKPCHMITIVSGVPRSGTSMMMKMLEAGGMEVVVDHIRTADEDNPQGYYELEQVKKLPEDSSFLEDTYGKAIKVISLLLYDLPTDKTYKIIFMRRHIAEVLASQYTMLQRRSTDAPTDDGKDMGESFTRHLNEITSWLQEQAHMDVIYVDYSEVIAQPLQSAHAVNRFLGNCLDVQRMASVVDHTLYRAKASPSG
jgi:hypothetical protein